MHSIRHWRLQATRYRLTDLRPPLPRVEEEADEFSKDEPLLSEENLREWFAKPMPLAT